ncbi:hypothetical protein [Clostridium sp. D46t1_190503_E9]|uniref:hypothetical protein n=1 Tax=Clostridium sp. D46t1_190503_E9 TaxID=2787137 RepID=UPI0018974487|nr:hypothetical protein [Clostridium sp. D46t1_190503_E9]
MKFSKLIALCTLSIFLIGCNKVQLKSKSEDNDSIITEDTNEETNNTTLNNIIEDKNKIEIPDNSKNVDNPELRNYTFVDKYIQGINLIKEFCKINSLDLKYVEPIQDRIGRFDAEHGVNLLEILSSKGSETVNYFTEDDVLNVDISIDITQIDQNLRTPENNTFSHIIYKASIENIDEQFNFKNSKLNEFRNTLVGINNLDYEKINSYINDMSSKKNKDYMVFFNKIDDDGYEVIRIENNNCYYRLVYDPNL